MNLFKRKRNDYEHVEVTVDREKGVMIIKSSEHLSERQLRELFEKYVLGDE
jgi:hypothetical protein